MNDFTYDLIEKYESLPDREAADTKILSGTDDSRVYYALSPDRINAAEAFPWKDDMRVLQLGACCGALVPLCDRVARWDILDPAEEELALVRARYPEYAGAASPKLGLRTEADSAAYDAAVLMLSADNSYVRRYGSEGEDAAALAKTRDCFCFCAFTSLRYSDMAKLRRSDITEDGLQVVTKKTHDRVTIDLNNYAREILNKYAAQEFPGGLALPVISNQKMNGYIKDLCELCEINEPTNMYYYKAGKKVEKVVPKYQLIGTHAGRRSFVVLALTMGIAPEIVMQWTGHSDYQAMKPYIDIVGAAKAEAMKKFNNLEGIGL